MKNRGPPPGAPPPPPPLSMAYERGKPSKDRRDALRRLDEDTIPILSSFCPIERYYSAANKVRDAFLAAYDAGKLDDAYVFGLRFSNFGTKALPSHDYYKSPRPELVALKNRNIQDLSDIITKMEDVMEKMDAEDFQRQIQEAEQRRKEEEQMRRYKEEEQRKWRLMRDEVRRKHGGSQRKLTEQEEETKKDISTSAAMKLELLNVGTKKMDPPPSASFGDMDLQARFAALQSPNNDGKSSFEHLLTDIPTMEDTLTGGELPMPVPVPVPPPPSGVGPPLPPPPSYSQVMGEDGSLPPPPPSSASKASQSATPKRKSSHKIPIETLKQVYASDYATLKKQQKIEVFQLRTYQGKTFDSTNGCTVIAPLVAVSHLKSSGPSVLDSAIETVIDRDAPPILRAVRSKLGLGGGALIIPSDVHDYMVDEKILQQDKFVGVCGGNIMDDNHIGEFLRMLETGKDGTSSESKETEGKKVAATLFFHEHVISILKVVPSSGTCWFDLVDSLPRNGGATRTRCKDRNALESLLRWYASAKFSNSDCNYIDKNEWNDMMCDFDPRVFQGFVWVE